MGEYVCRVGSITMPGKPSNHLAGFCGERRRGELQIVVQFSRIRASSRETPTDGGGRRTDPATVSNDDASHQ
ncbi:hypothetical protein NSPZN2_11473 [Nitrospira defluvii]|uniref:Uncharacterized protein n=1 Tax=Nitrospira defluvii TaxID=330214 RepID=A0ABM8QUP4_9BACT|nr:hypothetical protein NSPZN2_11473 [Nitrospira defluvii]